MNISTTNAKRLTSLAALGAGALTLGAGEAMADIVYVDLSGNPGKVGFDKGFNSSFNIPLPGTGIHFMTKTATTAGGAYSSVVGAADKGGKARLATSSGSLKLFKKNATWGNRASASTSAKVASRFSTALGSGTGGDGTFSKQYALFSFPAGAHTDYGWILLSDFVSDTNGPDLTILGYAYDTSGNKIPAGDTGVPEPSTLAMAGLGALALGAAGVRRWRAACKAA
ncbi:MAG: PEP-CTERM sorting domain-containing protein [Bryobacteraceae bacterium]|jgi:hypothetical protein